MRISPSKSKGRRRLIALADYVEERASDKKWRKFFDMVNWVGPLPDMDRNYKVGDRVEVNNECGTSACLLGHGVNVPSLKRAGLSNRVILRDGIKKAVLILKQNDSEIVGNSSFNGARVISDALFGISYFRYAEIFLFKTDYTMNKVTPKQAVKNLRKVVAEIDQNEGWSF